MISLLQGKVINMSNGDVTLLTPGGVGYRVMASPEAQKRCQVGTEVTLDCYLAVREDALDLFGFASVAEKELFKSFISVSGVGPKTALHLLELGSVEEITLAIGRGDLEYLTKVSGIGKKTAERIVVELKSKVKNQMSEIGTSMGAMTDAVSDVMDALVSLGYSVLEAREVVKKLDSNGKNSEQLLREALKTIK